MSTSATASQPYYVLLTVKAYPGWVRNYTTASTTTRDHHKIEVSLCPALPSNLYVHCPELNLTIRPHVVRAVEDLFLLLVALGDYSWPDESDYFIYRAGNRREPSLQWLSRPHPFFHDEDVDLLSHDAKYTIAALMATGTPVYDLHVFHSDNPTEWIYREVSVTEPLPVPEKCGRHINHFSNTVISIWGEGGTMGWVNLWYDILLCDVLRDEPTLRGMPMPVPLDSDLVSFNDGSDTELGCPTPFWDAMTTPMATEANFMRSGST
jgi:hypothetical protein